MKALIFAPKAAADIDHIYDYTEDTWGTEQAEGYTLGLQQFCDLLAKGMRRGKTLRITRKRYWSLSYKSHFIIYRETAAEIVIIRILHQRMNFRQHL
jgi:toxin ParE1/3/4